MFVFFFFLNTQKILSGIIHILRNVIFETFRPPPPLVTSSMSPPLLALPEKSLRILSEIYRFSQFYLGSLFFFIFYLFIYLFFEKYTKRLLKAEVQYLKN